MICSLVYVVIVSMRGNGYMIRKCFKQEKKKKRQSSGYIGSRGIRMSFFNISVKKSSYKKLRQIQLTLVNEESGRLPSWDEVIRLLLDLYEDVEAKK